MFFFQVGGVMEGEGVAPQVKFIFYLINLNANAATSPKLKKKVDFGTIS